MRFWRQSTKESQALTAHVISHTHWDREWYLPFQEFRLKLVDLIDDLLDILAETPDYRYFMLDGQAIILEDYLAVRPEREEELRQHIQSGRILIGPWYILPDEFLVSGEATIRNLMLGRRICHRFGSMMNIGYVPDPFGHISQLPQILAGFDINTAVFRRGLSDEPTLLRWSAPDGTRLFVVYLRDGYDNAAWLPTDPDEFTAAIQDRVESLAPHTVLPHILLMNGTDHMEPRRDLPALIQFANQHLDNITLVHSTLPQYLESVRNGREQPALDLSQTHGELRSPKRHHLLPGILSTRMWIKQRNYTLETLLERWAEPFNAWAWTLGKQDRSAQVWQAWRYLIENHPHDSICGCSVDQVHREMETRFDWAEQIAETVVEESLTAVAGQIHTGDLDTNAPIVVFNPGAGPRTDVVTVEMPLPAGHHNWTVVDADGRPLPTDVQVTGGTVLKEMELHRRMARFMFSAVKSGRIREWAIQDFDVQVDGDTAYVDVIVAKHATPSAEILERGRQRARELLGQDISTFKIRAHTGILANIRFVATDVPGHGYRTFALEKKRGTEENPEALRGTKAAVPGKEVTLENEFFKVQISAADGTLIVVDKRTGVEFQGLNRFVDGGDRGDEYDYCPPEDDVIVKRPAQSPEITYIEGAARQTMRIAMTYRLPAALTADRKARTQKTVDIPITTSISLSPGVPRVDVQTMVNNRAKDHRLRVHFPAPLKTDHSTAESQFDVVQRPVDLPKRTKEWVEQPVGSHPQRSFVDISDGELGLMVANRGLPEYEVVRSSPGNAIALTLLRCVGWLSRDDFPCRAGHAGPALATPEAQCLDEYTFEYSLIPHPGDWRTAFAQAHAFNAPLRGLMAVGDQTGALPLAGSLIEVEPADFVITAIKQAEAGDGVTVRGYNVHPAPIEARVRFSGPTHSIIKVNLAEEPIETLSVDADGWAHLPLRSREIVTLKFGLEG